jgi:hypothetical protein
MSVECNVSHKTCLEKGRAEEQVYGGCKEKRRKGKQKWVEDILFVLQHGRSQEKRHVSQSCRPAEGRGLQLLEKRDSALVMECNVGAQRAGVFVTQWLTSE